MALVSASALPMQGYFDIRTPTLVSEEPIIRDITTKKDEVGEVYRGTVSSDKLDLLRKQPESALKKAGIKVRNGAKIKVID